MTSIVVLAKCFPAFPLNTARHRLLVASLVSNSFSSLYTINYSSESLGQFMQSWRKYLLHSFFTAALSGAGSSFFWSSQSAYGMEVAFTLRSLAESKLHSRTCPRRGKQLLIKFLSRFERELEALRKELAESAARSPRTPSSAIPSGGTSENDLSSISPTSEVEIVGIGSSSESSPREISESKKDSWPISEIWFIIDIMHTANLWRTGTDGISSYYVAQVTSYCCTLHLYLNSFIVYLLVGLTVVFNNNL